MQPRRAAQTRCPYCHDDLPREQPATACQACQAAHHPECWAEHGRCGTCTGAGPAPRLAAPQECSARGCGHLARRAGHLPGLCPAHGAGMVGRCVAGAGLAVALFLSAVVGVGEVLGLPPHPAGPRDLLAVAWSVGGAFVLLGLGLLLRARLLQARERA